ncbi:MAG: kelch repeat-containing protein [Syntrophobacteraceae bacterium]
MRTIDHSSGACQSKRYAVSLIVLAVFLFIVCPPSSYAALDEWTYTGDMLTPRGSHTTTSLADGKVLVTGGLSSSNAPSGTLAYEQADIYDPSTGTWAATDTLGNRRFRHSATLLPNGKVLVVGGQGQAAWSALAACELYDPSTGQWDSTADLAGARYHHTATLLPNGKVLVAGGYISGLATATCELYDPSTGLWEGTGSMAMTRRNHTATLLPDGKVLVAGGFGKLSGVGGSEARLKSCEIYNPSNGAWSNTGNLGVERMTFTATLLNNGQVLAAGGYGYDGGGGSVLLETSETYNRSSGAWTPTGEMSETRSGHVAILLRNGKVLVLAGGAESSYRGSDVYDPATGLWTVTGSLNISRLNHSGTVLPNGSVLVTGGFSGAWDINLGYISDNSCEIYDYSKQIPAAIDLLLGQ